MRTSWRTEAEHELLEPEAMDPRQVLLAVAAYTNAPLPADVTDPDVAVALCRFANWYAKQTGDYGPKVAAFAAAALLADVEYGWQPWEGVFRLDGPNETSSAHDPYGDLRQTLEAFGVPYRETERRWDGIRRQDWAPELLESLPDVWRAYLRKEA